MSDAKQTEFACSHRRSTYDRQGRRPEFFRGGHQASPGVRLPAREGGSILISGRFSGQNEIISGQEGHDPPLSVAAYAYDDRSSI